MENAIEIIEAIGEQWPMVLVLFIIGIFIIKWNTLWGIIASISQVKIKKGDTEVEVSKESNVESGNKEQTLIEGKADNKEEVLDKKEWIDDKKEDNLNKQYYKELKGKMFRDAKKTFDKILAEDPDENNRKLRLINNYYWRHLHGDTIAFDEFEEYITKAEFDNEQMAIVNRNLSNFYENAGNSDKAIELLNAAIEFTNIAENKAFYVTRISEILYENEKKNDAAELLFEYLTRLDDRKSRYTLYSSIAKFYQKEENKMLEALAYQKALESQPNDTNLLFNVAYNYSRCDENFKDIGLIFYKRLVLIDPNHESSLNNIGVAYKNLNLPFKSVSYYKRALDVDSTISASNLAYLLMDGGFAEEAEKYLNDAQKKNNVHDNVFTAVSALKGRLSGEKEKEEKIVEKAEKKIRFLNSYGDAIFDKAKNKLQSSEKWDSNGIQAHITSENNTINISWKNEEEPHSVFGIRIKNAFNLTYKKPKRNYYSWQTEKYSFTEHTGYGVMTNESKIECMFEVGEEIIEFKFTR